VAVRDKLRERLAPRLEPGEQIQNVFLAETGPSPMTALISAWLRWFTKYWVITKPDRRIAVFSASKFRSARPRAHQADFPLGMSLEHTSGAVWQSLRLGDKRYRVHRRFRSDLEETARSS
jgi:hypothetical protein